jgi:hypothetical protein
MDQNGIKEGICGEEQQLRKEFWEASVLRS